MSHHDTNAHGSPPAPNSTPANVLPSLDALAAHLHARRVEPALAEFRAVAPSLGALLYAPTLANRTVPMLFDLGLDLREAWLPDATEEVLRHTCRLADAHRVVGLSAAARNILGLLYLDSVRLREARAAFSTAIALRRTQVARLGDRADAAVYLAGALCNLGHVARGEGDHAAAVELYTQAIAQL